MPVGLQALPALHAVSGVRLGTTAAGVRYPNRKDLVLIVAQEGTEAAAVFTRNRFRAAPVDVAARHLSAATPRALLINTGCANAGTGEPGKLDAEACCRAVAEALGCSVEQVLPFSTGVIGEPLPVARVVAGVPACVEALAADGWTDAASGIMTTDTVPKGASRCVDLAGTPVTVTGIAKGAGMLRPDMATMLAFIATDAPVAGELLDVLLRRAVGRSFNRITVDGDTSTNDACVLLATGEAGGTPISSTDDPRYEPLFQGIMSVCELLAQALVRDAEGATKFITVTVSGGASETDCLRAAYAVAESPLVKTAFFASDPNWGRILAAVGRAGLERLDIDRVTMHLGDVRIVADGGLDADYREADGQRVMAESEIAVRIDLGVGTHGATVWTCDLSHEYVRINAEYRT